MTSLLAVLFGQVAANFVPELVLKRVCGGIFVAIGALLIVGWF